MKRKKYIFAVIFIVLFLAVWLLCTQRPESEPEEYIKPESCGNGVCDMRIDGYPNPEDQYHWNEESVEENHINCPEECEIPDISLIVLHPIRPLVSGIRMSPTSGCSLGYITYLDDKKYVITAGHCLSWADRFNITDKYINMRFEQGGQPLGKVVAVPKDYWVDVALIEIYEDVEAIQMTALGHKYSGFGEPYVGQRVFKVGGVTGTTYGTIEEIQEAYMWECASCADMGAQLNYTRIKIRADDRFASVGDSGAAVLSLDEPHQFLGIIFLTSADYSFAITPEEIMYQLDLYGAV